MASAEPYVCYVDQRSTRHATSSRRAVVAAGLLAVAVCAAVLLVSTPRLFVQVAAARSGQLAFKHGVETERLLLNEPGDYYSWNDQQKVIDARGQQDWKMWKDFHFCGNPMGGRSCHFGAFNDWAMSKYYGTTLDICNEVDSTGCNGASTWARMQWPGTAADWHTLQVRAIKAAAAK